VLVDLLCEETDVNSINPLEIAPMGDVDLAEVKAARGRQISLMGNLHTTNVMLNGAPELVRTKAIEAMRAAGPGGGFILSTGDQCGPGTPEENLFALVEAAREFGTYDAAGRLPALDQI
jgi:uroporphyrinogen decarboxylase